MKDIKAKLGTMRQEVSWTVCPRPTNVEADYPLITIQSDHRECVINTKTGIGILSAHAANYPKAGTKGSKAITVPREVIDAAIAAQPKKGDVICGVMTIA